MKKTNKINVTIFATVIFAFSFSSMAETGQELTLNATKEHPGAKAGIIWILTCFSFCSFKIFLYHNVA